MNNKELTGCDTLREWLVAMNFRVDSDANHEQYNQCNWYAYRPTALVSRECECNDGKPVVLFINPYRVKYTNTTHESVEVYIVGQADGRWYHLQCYSISPSELMQDLSKIETSLVAAWNALHLV